jgi:hypothetical protein
MSRKAKSTASLRWSITTPRSGVSFGENAPWPRTFDETDKDPEINRWREELQRRHGAAFFSLEPRSIDLVGVLTRWLSEKAKEEPKEAAATTPAPSTHLKIVRVLLSSPGDVTEEREAYARAVSRFNQDFIEQTGIFVKLIRWEDMAPQIGPGHQNVIKAQIEDYHLLSLIMWNRFGTPTDIAASGTEEEFNDALGTFQKTGHPWIVTYFCARETNLRTLDQIEQKSRVIRFRDRAEKLGIVKEHRSVEDLERMAYEDLRKITTRPTFLEYIGKQSKGT